MSRMDSTLRQLWWPDLNFNYCNGDAKSTRLTQTNGIDDGASAKPGEPLACVAGSRFCGTRKDPKDPLQRQMLGMGLGLPDLKPHLKTPDFAPYSYAPLWNRFWIRP